MNTRVLMIVAFGFFLCWKQAADSFLLFCALFALGLWVCVVIHRMETTRSTIDDDTA